MRLTLRSLAALPASSSTSAVRYSSTAVTYTAAVSRLVMVLVPVKGNGTFGANAHLVLSVIPEKAFHTTTGEL